MQLNWKEAPSERSCSEIIGSEIRCLEVPNTLLVGTDTKDWILNFLSVVLCSDLYFQCAVWRSSRAVSIIRWHLPLFILVLIIIMNQNNTLSLFEKSINNSRLSVSLMTFVKLLSPKIGFPLIDNYM